ncbi:MAG: PAS domain S-box protein [Chloroflexi bacterium]|nr:PAS domain S-box protein [Chloroflexota bacterium]MDA1173074.1 PAS domain S-box protein [Chloroflexota bacterium]
MGIDDAIFRTLVETATVGICIFRGDTRLFVNQTYVDQHGLGTIDRALASEAHVGSDPADLLKWREVEDHLGEASPFRFGLRQPDGTRKILEATFSRIEYEGTPAWVSVTRDVTENDSNRRAIRASEARFRELFELAPVGIAIADADRVTIDANPALAAMLGTTVENLVGHRVRDFGSNQRVAEERNAYGRMVAGEIDEVSGDREFVHTNGSGVVAHMITIPVRNDDGAFLYALRVFEDVTERVNMKRAQSEFIAVTSHELRTPLTAIHAAVLLVASGAYGELPRPVQRLLEIASENSERMVTLTTDLIDLERMDLGKLTLRLVPSDAADLALRARDSIAALADQAGIEIDLDASPISLMADQTRVAQVLTNLLSNAIKFSERLSSVTLQVRSDGGVVRFAVIDHGPGIPGHHLAKIFDRFHQVDSSDTRSKGGWGLGLAVSQAIAEQHGGRIWAQSKLGLGTTFFFEVPSSLAHA